MSMLIMAGRVRCGSFGASWIVDCRIGLHCQLPECQSQLLVPVWMDLVDYGDDCWIV